MRLYRRIRSSAAEFPFLRANFKMGWNTVTRLATGIARVKFSAVFLGTSGIGLLGVGTQAQMLGSTWGSLAMGAGFTRMMSGALASGDTKRRQAIMSTMFTLQVGLNLSLLAVGLIVAKPLAAWIFTDTTLVWCLVPILLSIPLSSLVSSYLQGILYSHGRYDLYTLASVSSAGFEMVLFIVLVYFYGIQGAFWALALGAAVWVGLLLFNIFKLEPKAWVLRFSFDRQIAHDLIFSSTVMLMTGSITYLVNMCVRILIIKEAGAATNGIYQVLLAFTAYYSPLITSGVWARLYPRISGEGLNEDTVREWTDSLVWSAMGATAIQLGLLILPGTLISSFYSSAFSKAIPLLPLQLVGDFCFLIAQPSMGVVLGTARLKTYLSVWTVYFAGFYFLSQAFMPRMGLTGILLSYFLSSLALAGFSLIFYSTQVKDKPRVLRTWVVLMSAAMMTGLQAEVCFKQGPVALRVLIFLAWNLMIALVLGIPAVRRLVLEEGPRSIRRQTPIKKRESGQWQLKTVAERELGSGLANLKEFLEAYEDGQLIAKLGLTHRLPIYEGDEIPSCELVWMRHLGGLVPREVIQGLLEEAKSKAVFKNAEFRFFSGSTGVAMHEDYAQSEFESVGGFIKVHLPTQPGLLRGYLRRGHDHIPLLMNRAICQNDFQVLASRPVNSEVVDSFNGQILVFEWSGNLIWGKVFGSAGGVLAKAHLKAAGLILNKPHLFKELLRQLRVHHKITSVGLEIHESSPLASLFNTHVTKPAERKLYVFQDQGRFGAHSKGSLRYHFHSREFYDF